MVTDKNTLLLLSRLADAQLALAESMRGITISSPTYPAEALERIDHAMTAVEACVLEIRSLTSTSASNGSTKLH